MAAFCLRRPRAFASILVRADLVDEPVDRSAAGRVDERALNLEEATAAILLNRFPVDRQILIIMARMTSAACMCHWSSTDVSERLAMSRVKDSEGQRVDQRATDIVLARRLDSRRINVAPDRCMDGFRTPAGTRLYEEHD